MQKLTFKYLQYIFFLLTIHGFLAQKILCYHYTKKFIFYLCIYSLILKHIK